MGSLEEPPRHTSLEVHLNGSCTHLQIGTGNVSWILSAGDDGDGSDETGDQLHNEIQPVDLCVDHVPEPPAQSERHSIGMKRKFKDVSDQLNQLEYRTEEGFLDLTAEIDEQNEIVERSLKLQKRETEMLTEDLLLTREEIEKQQREMKALKHLQQLVLSLTLTCSDLETGKLDQDRKMHEMERKIHQLESEIHSTQLSGSNIKFPEMEPCLLLMLDGRLSVREIQMRTRDWLKIRDNWFIQWRDWIRIITNWWSIKNHVPHTRELFYNKIREWIGTIRDGVELYIEFHGQLIRHYKFVKKLPKWKRKALKWNELKELNIKIREVRLNKKVLGQGCDEELSNLQSWLYNQTWGRVGVEGTMKKYLATSADGLVEWLKQVLYLDAAKMHLGETLKAL